MSIPVVFFPVINRSDLLLRAIHSLNYPIDKIVVLNNGQDQGVIDILAQLSQEIPNLTVHHSKTNLGVSASWNYCFRNYPADWWLIVGSDIQFSSNDLRLIDEGMRRHPEHVIRFGNHGHSFFGIRPECIEKAGYFDENLFPAYLEDIDHLYRINLLGLPWADIGKAPDETEQCHAIHGTAPEFGSSAIYGDPKLFKLVQERNEINLSYFQKKWGGDPGHEVFKTPFNDPSRGVADW